MARRLETLFDRYRRRGDAAALGRVFDRTAPELVRVAMHLARHPAEAEDLLQETFLTAIARADTYDAERPLVPWLVGILRNHARSARRRRRAATDAVEAVSPREPWMDVDWSDAVAEQVEALPEPYREVLVLLLRHGRPPAEIAVLLDRPPATVRSQIHRGLDRLRRRLPPRSRPAALLALPVGAGLDAVRARVMSEAAAAGAATTVGTGTLLTAGGLVVSKKSIVTSVVLLSLLALGAAVWTGGWLDRAEEEEPEAERAVANEPSDETGGPVLVGSPPAATSTEGGVAVARPEEAPAATWPPDVPIPADKGSVAGRIRLTDGSPLAGVPVALWGSPSIVAVTDEQGRYHVHADWVHDRAVFVRLGASDEPDWLGIILSTGISMRAGELVLRDVTIERGLDLEAAVVDEDTDEPLAGATVTMRRRDRYEGQACAAFVRTDERGRFRIPYVPPDAYTLELVCEGYQACVRPFDLVKRPFPDLWRMTPARALVVVFENLPEGAVGTEVGVDLDRMDETSFSFRVDRTIRPDGSVTIDAPEPGTYRLTVFKTDHVPRLTRDIEIGRGVLAPIVLTVPRGSRVEGTLLTADARPIAEAGVRIGKAAGYPQTDEEGRFAFEHVASGRHVVWAHLEGASVRFGTVDVGDSGTTRVVLAAPGLSRLEGTLRVGGASVEPYNSELKVREAGTDHVVATVRPGPPGSFVVPMLPAGRYEVVAWASRGVAETREVVLRRAETVELGVIDLVPMLRVPVELVFPDAVEPPPPVQVVALVDGGAFAVRLLTEVDGRTWLDGLPPGPLRLLISCEGYEQVVKEVDVRPDAVEPLRVEFLPR